MTSPPPQRLLPLARLEHPPNQDPFLVYIDGCDSPETARAVRRCLSHMAELYLKDAGRGGEIAPPPDSPVLETGQNRAWGALRYEDTMRIRTLLADEDRSPSGFNQHLSALRRVLQEAWLLGQIPGDDYQRAVKIKGSKGKRERAGRTVSTDELTKLLSICLTDVELGTENTRLIGLRDAAIIAFLYGTGARRAEAAGALIERYDPGRRTCRILGKGNKERTVIVHKKAVPWIDRWLLAFMARRGPMFCSIDQWNHKGEGHLAERSIGRIVSNRRVQAGLLPLTTHDLRRAFGTTYLDGGGNIVHLQHDMGHANIQTTADYWRGDHLEMQAAVDEMPFPTIEQIAAIINNQPEGSANGQDPARNSS
jgi:integrase